MNKNQKKFLAWAIPLALTIVLAVVFGPHFLHVIACLVFCGIEVASRAHKHYIGLGDEVTESP